MHQKGGFRRQMTKTSYSDHYMPGTNIAYIAWKKQVREAKSVST